MTRARWALVVGGALLVLIVGAVVVASMTRSDDTEPRPFGLDPTGDTSGGEADPNDPCSSVHAGHNLMMWDSTMADEMVDAGCGWPYDPFVVDAEGGEEDPALDAAPFEPRHYADIWQAITPIAATCAVIAIPEEPGDGFVFGFRYELATDACDEDGAGDVRLDVREMVTRAHRDATAGADDADAVLVLGRWVLSVTGDGDGVTAVSGVLEDLGAVVVPADG